jgi:hypothetical protein
LAVEIPVLIIRLEGNGFQARGGEPLALTAEGDTSEEALANLREMIAQKLAGGSSLVSLDVPGANNPWLRLDGVYKDEPLFEEWQRAIEENRRKEDEEPIAE